MSPCAVAAGVRAAVGGARRVRAVGDVLGHQPAAEVQQRAARCGGRQQRRGPAERRTRLVGPVADAQDRGRVGEMAALAGRAAPLVVVMRQRLGGAQRVLGRGPAGGREHAALHQERGATERGRGVMGGVRFQ